MILKESRFGIWEETLEMCLSDPGFLCLTPPFFSTYFPQRVICNNMREFTWFGLVVKHGLPNIFEWLSEEWMILKLFQFSPALLVFICLPTTRKIHFQGKVFPVSCSEILLGKHPPACKLTLIHYNKYPPRWQPLLPLFLLSHVPKFMAVRLQGLA